MNPIEDLLSQYQEAYDLFSEATILTDSTALGRAPTEHEARIFSKASDLRTKALDRLLDYRPRTFSEVSQKAKAIIDNQILFDLENEDNTLQLLESLAQGPADSPLEQAITNFETARKDLSMSETTAPTDNELDILLRGVTLTSEYVLSAPCQTIQEISRKANYITANPELLNHLRVSDNAPYDLLRSFNEALS